MMPKKMESVHSSRWVHFSTPIPTIGTLKQIKKSYLLPKNNQHLFCYLFKLNQRKSSVTKLLSIDHDLLVTEDVWRLNIRLRQPFYPINFSAYRTTNSIHLSCFFFLRRTFVLLTIKLYKSHWVSIPDTFHPTENAKGRIIIENFNDVDAHKSIAIVAKHWIIPNHSNGYLLVLNFWCRSAPWRFFCLQTKNKVPICSANYQVPCMTFWWNSNDCRHFNRRSVHERFISFDFRRSTVVGGVWKFPCYSGRCNTSTTSILSIYSEQMRLFHISVVWAHAEFTL